MNCNHLIHREFMFQEDFEAFLNQIKFEKHFELIEFKNNHLFLIPNVVKLKCKLCNSHWYLSEPDNSWRGFFLDEQSYFQRVKLLESGNHNSKRWPIVLMILLAIFLALWLSG